MSSANPYAPPQSDVNAEASGTAGSVEDALAGRYDFTIEEVMKDAWRLTNGFKLTFWGAAIVVGVVVMIVAGILAAITNKMGVSGAVLRQVVSQAITYPVMIGVVMLAVRRAGGLPVTIGHAFSYFDRWLPALIAGVLSGILTSIGFLLLVIPGIYLSVAYGLTMPLIGDRKMGAWDALETSRKAVTHKWFKCFGVAFVAGIITAISALPLLIPLIWTLPWYCMVLGVCYRRIFGVASTA